MSISLIYSRVVYKKAKPHSTYNNSQSEFWVALDFDGVVCDSVHECFISSQIAYQRLQGLDFSLIQGDSNARAYIDSPQCQQFIAMRPACSTGSDFLVLQNLLHSTPLSEIAGLTMQDAEHAIVQTNKLVHQKYRDVLYETRHWLMEHRWELWQTGNIPYPWARSHLADLGKESRVIILSTKKSGVIQRILQGWNVVWPVNRIFEAGPGASKKDILEELGQGGKSVVKHWLFIDDHLPHLEPILGVDTIQGRLALWGYTTGDSVQGIEVLEQEKCYPIIRHHLDLKDQRGRHILPD